ncbi:hypothetical protein UPYG_G00210980 [Umbra pygmaea]|uniref:SprT-like domain-containing protein n=1 Tax=Umbra pygmaea TaxID=75934 RepID=A0ABD0X7K0_UMBPY
MDGDTKRLFNRVAEKVGWSERGGLKMAEKQLIKHIRNRHVASGCNSSTRSPDLPLHLIDSEEENDEGLEKENHVRQTSKCDGYRTTMLIESSDDDFDQFLVEQATPKTRKPCNAAKKISDPVLVLSSDSDDSFEKFLSRVKTPKSKKADSGSENSLKNFIVNSFLSDDDDFVIEKKKTHTSKGASKTPKSLARKPLVRKPLSQCDSPVFLSEDDDDSIVVTSTWKTRHTKLQPPAATGTHKTEVEQSNSVEDILCTSTALPLSSSSPPLSFLPPSLSTTPAHRTQSAPSMPLESSSSDEEFLSLLERIKKNNKTGNTPTPNHKTGPCEKPSLSTPRTKAPKQPGTVPVRRSPVDLKTPIRLPASKPKVSQTEARPLTSSLQSSRALATVCKTPGCFLQSLSGPGSNYSRSFKQTKEELTSKLYRLYNTSVFDSKLPSDMSVSWNKKMRKTAGYCITGQMKAGGIRYARIELSEKVCDSADRLRDTLIHEMCHAATWLINSVRDGHGSFWKLYARKATLAHPELPMVTRCHSYDINYKYQYRCSRCENTIGRHSKSLDTQRFVCALCTGQLVLLTPAKPRAPTPFATFVKENYGSTRQELAGQSHGEVMRKLSADFATKTKLV